MHDFLDTAFVFGQGRNLDGDLMAQVRLLPTDRVAKEQAQEDEHVLVRSEGDALPGRFIDQQGLEGFVIEYRIEDQ